MSSEPIIIATSANATYAPHAAAMLHSLFSSNPDTQFEIRFPHRENLEPEILDRLGDLCARFGANWAPQSLRAKETSHFRTTDNYPEEAWYRLILPDLYADLDRILWLDADVLVLHSINELWKTKLDGMPLAASSNVLPFENWTLPAKLGVKSRKNYFNTGVLIMDLKMLRSENATTVFRQAATQNQAIIQHADQDVMNAVYSDRYKQLPLRWNVIATTYYLRPECVRIHGREEYLAALKAPRIVHFTGGKRLKPWSFSSPHRFRSHYLHHRNEAGWGHPEPGKKELRDYITRRLSIRLLVLISKLSRGHIRSLIATL